MQEKFQKVMDKVKENPVKSAAIAVGVGVVITGVVLAVRHGVSVEEELETIGEAIVESV